MHKLLTVKEVANFLRCHPQSVYRNKELSYIKIPGIGMRYKESELDKYVEQKSIKTHSLMTPLNSVNSFILTNLDDFDKIFLKQNKGGNCGSMNEKKTRWNYGFGSVYIRKTKQGKVRWYADYQAEGKRIREVVKNAQSRAEAILHLQEKVTKVFNQVHGLSKKRKPINFTELSDTYLQNYAKVNKKSWKDDMYRIEAQLKPFFGHMKLNEITPLFIESYRAKRLEAGVTKSTINRELTIMKKMFNLAIDWKLANENPALKVKLFSEKDTMKERILSEEEEIKLLAESPEYLKPILFVALNTGMRRGEILNLRWKQVDLSKRIIKVENTKSGKNRIIPINDCLFRELLKVVAQNGEGDYVFLNPDTGRPYTEVKKSFKNACKRAEIDDLRFHDLRHTFATRLIESKVDLITVRDLLGHFSVRVTQRYTHSSQIQKKKAVELLANKGQKKAGISDEMSHICHIKEKEKVEKPATRSFLVN